MDNEFDHEKFMADLGESLAKAREIIQMRADELETAVRHEPENVAKLVTGLYLAQIAGETVSAIAHQAEKRLLGG